MNRSCPDISMLFKMCENAYWATSMAQKANLYTRITNYLVLEHDENLLSIEAVRCLVDALIANAGFGPLRDKDTDMLQSVRVSSYKMPSKSSSTSS